MMSRLWLVIRHEYLTSVRRRTFLIVLVGVPIVIALLTTAILLLAQRSPGRASEVAVGYVDEAGLLASPLPSSTLPEEGLHTRFVAFATIEQARAALEAAQVVAYFVVPPDYTSRFELELVYTEEPNRVVTSQFLALLRTNLLAGQPPEVVRRAVAGSTLVLRTPDGRPISAGTILGQLLPAVTSLALVILIFFGAGHLMQAVNDERTNRTIEIVETSVSPGQLIGGKVLGIAGANLTQFGAWVVLAVLAVLVAGVFPGMDWLRDIRVEPGQLLLMIAIVLPAYLLLAGLLTALGTLLPDGRASEQVSSVVLTLYMTMVGFLMPILRIPESPLATGLTLFPLTAPVVLPLRAAFFVVPAWQIVVSIALLVLSAAGAVWLAARALRLGRMRYGQGLRLGELLGSRARYEGRAGRPAWSRPASGMPDGQQPRQLVAHKIWPVLRFELRTGLTKPAFLLVPIGIPLLIFVQLGLTQMAFSDKPLVDTGPIAEQPAEAAVTLQPQGYVDEGGWLQIVPANIPAGTLRAFPDEDAARQALAAGRIAGYYVIPADYVTNGEMVYVPARYNPLAPQAPPELMEYLLLANLLQGDMDLAGRVWTTPRVQETVWSPEQASGAAQVDDELGNFMIPMLIMLVPYSVILLAAGFLLRTISEEKTNRTMEVLLVSLDPRKLLLGKLVAWGLLGLLQAVLLAGFGYVLFFGTGQMALPAGLSLSPSFLVWVVVLSLLGYAVYASLMAGAGALMPNWREARGPTFLLTMPALLGFYVAMIAINEPNGLPMVLVSLFPLTAPFTMAARLIRTTVPLWQLLLACALMILTAWSITRSVAAMFNAQNLLTGQPFSIKRYLSALRGRG